MKAVGILSLCFLALTININCEQPHYNQSELCYQFYKLNKTNEFRELYDLNIGGRYKSEYDKNANQYDLSFNYIEEYDLKTKQYITIPVFNRGANDTTKKVAFKKCSDDIKDYLKDKFKSTSDPDLFLSYVNYVERVLIEYYSIRTPSFYNNKSVAIEGNPSSGQFITFKLNDKTKCFYLKDRIGLSAYWLNFFNNSKKFSDNWYYEIRP
ncbi:hypothetical protein G7092_24560 [Mucilaginibacter sp. HC2]|uniref:hypothetical protein n=1 Tax=Mucilaginibacter inviolabilis TaxID=2714892 RepID=UPI00140B964A|nr:hypothetical protein [Mucilaginibacter inviolabilis]NHA06995.1 hypothetical protein [Mucilaginibacter inviolabilis]